MVDELLRYGGIIFSAYLLYHDCAGKIGGKAHAAVTGLNYCTNVK
ncbi:Uncharacterised protein [uncultured archaeon]|nr:Uncharacterised protein [uncultured archaeon]